MFAMTLGPSRAGWAATAGEAPPDQVTDQAVPHGYAGELPLPRRLASRRHVLPVPESREQQFRQDAAAVAASEIDCDHGPLAGRDRGSRMI